MQKSKRRIKTLPGRPEPELPSGYTNVEEFASVEPLQGLEDLYRKSLMGLGFPEDDAIRFESLRIDFEFFGTGSVIYPKFLNNQLQYCKNISVVGPFSYPEWNQLGLMLVETSMDNYTLLGFGNRYGDLSFYKVSISEVSHFLCGRFQ